MGLSSAQTGLSMSVPYKIGEKQYIDDEVGVYTNANYKQLENTDTKQVMARLQLLSIRRAVALRRPGHHRVL